MKTLLLVHGWGAGPWCWQRQENFFRNRREILAPSVPAWDSGWLTDLLTSRSVNDLVAVGWSLGGMILMEALASSGLKPARVVLLGAPALFCRRPDHPLGQRPAAVRAMRQALRQDAGGVLRSFARQCLAPGEGEWAAEVAACFSGTGDIDLMVSGLDYLLDRDLRPLLPQLPGRCVIIQGDQDAIVSWEQGEFLQAHLPGATLERVAGGGHAPFITQSEAVNAILEDVLGGFAAF